MPTYLCHGFRWHRRDIRIFVILNDLEDAAPNWVLAPASSYCILDQLHAKYDFLPELSPPTTPTQKSISAKNANIKKQFDHVDDDHALPTSRVSDAEDAVLMHSWSPVKLLEEFDVDEMVTACRPYAYVADYVVRVDLSVDVAGQMAKYYDKMAGEDGWIMKLRNELQKGEPVRWYVVVCGDDVREVPGKSDEEEKEYDDDNDRDEDGEDALTVLDGILGGADGAATPRPLSRTLPDIDIPLQPQPDPNRASVMTMKPVSTASSVWPGTYLNVPKELVPPRTPSPTSEYSPQPQNFGSNMPKFEGIVPHAPPLLVSPNPARLEQPSSGILYEAGDTISEQQLPSTPMPNAKQVALSNLDTKAAKELVSKPSASATTPTSAHRKTINPVLKTPPRNPTTQQNTQKSPKSRLPRSVPKNIRISNVPLPPEPEIKTPRRPPTPPKPRGASGGNSQKRPQTAPEKGTPSSKAHARMLSMPYRYEAPSSLQELEREEPILEPTPSLASDYNAGVSSKPSAPRDLARGVRLRAPQPVAATTQSRQTSVSTEHSDGQVNEDGRHPKQRIGRSHSVAEGLKKLFRKPSHAKAGHHH
ncbi:hypothetical protein FOC1_g10011203 [Fusarium oxysporum f. sp. cubense race 1]|uniref:Uncharacterized protein n=1 Tax=Fusarium oxysporum f. sp. cubense (strain race 1) TaxID=1229664 RepID=N4UDJ0_FUSC1|nr:hypothetical protein FOC1_g10011203 [Fusarium oxysporum f. sp. cubense race 1]